MPIEETIQKEKDDMSVLTEISENLQKGKAKVVKQLVQQAIDEGISVQQILDEGLLDGMNVVGEKFKNNEVFVPEVLVAARAMNMGAGRGQGVYRHHPGRFARYRQKSCEDDDGGQGPGGCGPGY